MGLFVDCKCDPEIKDNYKYVQWIGSLFGDCIYTPLEKFSYYAGVFSLVFYFIAFYPQIYENYRRKTTDGLSLLLIIIWFFGDFANYIGTVLTEQYPIQKIVGIYFALMEIIIIVQYIYYKFFYRGPVVIDDGEDHEPTERDRLIIKTDGENGPISRDSDIKDIPPTPPSQHTYETFSDIQKVPIQPPLDPNEGVDATPKASTSATNGLQVPENLNSPAKTLSPSILSNQSNYLTPPDQFPPDESSPSKAPEPIPEEESVPDTPKYETFDEISQKQQQQQQQQQQQKEEEEETPVQTLDSNIDKDSKTNTFSNSVSSSLSQANMRGKSSNGNSNSSSQEDITNADDDDDEEEEEDTEFKSELSLDTRNDDDENGLSRSESSINKKKKKGRKGKKGKKGKKPKRGKGLSTAIQTLALFSLFILQIQARAVEFLEETPGYMDEDDHPNTTRLCNAGPNLNLAQKIFGSLMAWSSGILYFTCRIPQIVENKRNRSVEGLTIILFVCTILGNLFYGLSILTRFPPIDTKFFTGTLPYLIGSIGTFIFDIIIIYQFQIYKSTGVTYHPIEGNH